MASLFWNLLALIGDICLISNFIYYMIRMRIEVLIKKIRGGLYMKEVRVKLQNKTTLELLEDASKGDVIRLDNLDEMQLDLSEVQARISEGTDIEYKKLLNKEIENLKAQNDLVLKAKASEFEIEKQREVSKREQEIIELKSLLDNNIKTKEIELKAQYEKQIVELMGRIEAIESKGQLLLENEKSKLEIEHNKEKQQLATKLEIQKQEIELLKDFKLKQSTKMVGENLEQHCEIMYNQYGRTAFPNAEFYKDNDAKTGSKGDFIYKEYDENGVLMISVMFEMKNEQDTTATKKKNKDFYKELDKDRREKDCEYAVLVSMLEQDNELFNDITKVWEFENMYVVRPQHFINIISLLRIGAVKSHKYRLELENAKNANIDILNFESNLNNFKTDFGRNYRLASERFQSAIEEIDKSILHLTKIKENLTRSEDNLRIANNKLDDLSVQKIAKNNPTITKMLQEDEKE